MSSPPPVSTRLLWKCRSALHVLYGAAESHAAVARWVGWVKLSSLWHMLVVCPWGHREK